MLPRDPTLELCTWRRAGNRAWSRNAERRVVHRRRQAGAAAGRDARGGLRSGWTDDALEACAQEFDKRQRRHGRGKLEVSGSGYFSSIVKNRTQTEATCSARAATLGMILLMWLAYRNFTFTLLGALPLVSAALAGLAAVSALFDSVHGITLAFGFTLIGVAQDYPIHLFSHLEPQQRAIDIARRVWPPLATGPRQHLHRLSRVPRCRCHRAGPARLPHRDRTAGGGLHDTLLLPHIVDAPRRDHASSALLGRDRRRIERLPRPFAAAGGDSAGGARRVPVPAGGLLAERSVQLTPVPPGSPKR